MGQLVLNVVYQVLAQKTDLIGQLGLVLHDQFSGCRRCRRSQIGDKIGDGKIDLMADARDDRYLRSGDGPRDDFFVKSPEVFVRTAAPSDQQDIESAVILIEVLDRSAISYFASSPCTRTGYSRISTLAKRRSITERISRIAAPVGDVTMPIFCGSSGIGLFRSWANSPSFSSFCLELFKGKLQSAFPCRF